MFKFNLSEETKIALAVERAEALRHFTLTDTWLAAALLRLARDAQRITPDCKPDDNTYDARLIYGAVPEIARRLGPVKLVTDEIDWEMRELNNYELRERAGNCLLHIRGSDLPGWVMLTREVCDGNPVVFALDRLCPGVLGNRDDALTRRLTEIAAYRKKLFNGVWTPAMLGD